MDRKEVYQVQNKSFSWPLRGIGYLHHTHDVVLLGEIATSQARIKNDVRDVVRIYNVKNPIDCSKILIWVRVNGPEIFAGHANPVTNKSTQTNNATKCYWEFEFDAKKSGSYSVDAKVLLWNPDASKQSKSPVGCETSKNSSLVDLFPIHASFFGFKMGAKNRPMCCEICSRLAGHCKGWSIPIPAFPYTNAFHNGCVLYFADASVYSSFYSTMLNDVLKNETKFDLPEDERAEVTYGLPHSQPTTYFLGCGWSYWFTLDFPCLSGDLDDRVFFIDNTFVFPLPKEKEDIPLHKDEGAGIMSLGQIQSQAQTQNLCKIDTESSVNHNGRWVRKPWPTKQECPNIMERDPDKERFDIMKFDGNNPHCWHRDDFSNVGNRCMEYQCQWIEPLSRWRSSIHEEKYWYGNWQHDSGCSYSEYTDEQLQLCVDRRKLYGFEVEGSSIATYMNEYLSQRLKNITLYDNNNQTDGTKITLSSFSLLHKMDDRQKWEDMLKLQRNITQSSKEEFYWFNGSFLSSERDLWAFVSIMPDFNLMAEKILQPKGYKMLNAFDMSAAFTYDIATQSDGMHIIGPPMKMIVTKFFHYLCSSD